MCEPLESRQLLSTGVAVAAAPAEPVVMIRTTQNAKESADLSKHNGIFTIKRTGPTSAPLEVHYTVNTSVPDSATPGVDYVALSGVAIIPAHKSSVKVLVQAFLDAVPEGRETVRVDLAQDAAYAVDARHPSAAVSIQNVFAIDAIAAFGDVPHAYTSTFRTTLRGESQPKSITTADAAFPLDILGFAAVAPVGGKYLILNGVKSVEGVFLDSMLLNQRSDQPSDTVLRSVGTRGADEKGGPEHSVLFIPPIVGPSSTRKLFANIAVHKSADTVPGTVHVTSKATKQVQVKTPAGTFPATKLVVTTIVTGKGRATVNARLTPNGDVIQRRLNVSVNDQFTWTYYLVPEMGVVKVTASGTFKQTTEFTMTFKASYVLAQPAAIEPPPVTA